VFVTVQACLRDGIAPIATAVVPGGEGLSDIELIAHPARMKAAPAGRLHPAQPTRTAAIVPARRELTVSVSHAGVP
jgi:hypothetical protein